MKTKLTKIPEHYRQRKNNEVSKAGDLCYRFGNIEIYRNEADFKVYDWPNHRFYCRRHVKTKKDQFVQKESELPFVEFRYPTKDGMWTNCRYIRLIAANNKYLIGLDVEDNFKFKKFSRSKISGGINVKEFNPSAIK